MKLFKKFSDISVNTRYYAGKFGITASYFCGMIKWFERCGFVSVPKRAFTKEPITYREKHYFHSNAIQI